MYVNHYHKAPAYRRVSLYLCVGVACSRPCYYITVSFPEDIPELRARLEGKDKQLEDKEKHIETLKKELEDNKATHNNYMFQIQTLINQKAIDAPGTKKSWWKFW